MTYDGKTLQEIIAIALASPTGYTQLTQTQKLAFDLYAAQGGFQGTGVPTM
jgi:hypothetical protein